MSTPVAVAPPNPKARNIVGATIAAVVFVLKLAAGLLPSVLILFALTGVPLFAAMGGATELVWLLDEDAGKAHLRSMSGEILGARFAGSPLITTIPLFTFVGYLLAESKTPVRLVRAASAWVGALPGGLAIVCVIASAIFTLFTGGSGVTIIAVGGLLYPALRKEGYSEKFSLGLVTTGGSVGLLLPYSLPLLVFALVSGLDFQLAFKAVLAPGLLVLLMLVAYSIWVGVKEKIPRTPFDAKEAMSSLWDFKWEMGIPVILVLGLKSGLAQIDEVAGIVAIYTLGFEVFIYKDLTWKKDISRIVRTSMSLSGAVILILAMASALVDYLVDHQVPNKALDAMLHAGIDKPWQFLLVMNLFLLVLGMIMDGFSAILVAAPLVLPFAAHFGLGPFHMAIMFVLNLELAFCCPPLGLNIFISSFRFNRPVLSLYKVVLPFLGILTIALLIVSYVPSISNVLVLKDMKARREADEMLGLPPRQAWLLECVQQDRSNPTPCTPEDKKKYPNGQAVVPESTAPVDAGAAAPTGDDDEDLEAMIRGGAKEGGAPAPAPKKDDDEDLEDFIRNGGKDKGDAGAP